MQIIERQFLKQSDLRDIHCDFEKQCSKSSLLNHLKIQFALGVAIAILFLLSIELFLQQESCAAGLLLSEFKEQRAIPYLVCLALVVFRDLIREGRLNAKELQGLAEEKLAYIDREATRSAA